MKNLKKITALFLSLVLAFSCMALIPTHASAANAILGISIVKLPNKTTYVQGTDWNYGYYYFPEDPNALGIFTTTGDKLTFVSGGKTYQKISFLHSGGCATNQYYDRGMLDLNGLVVKVIYSDYSMKDIEYKETKKGNFIDQNIYANPSVGEFFVGKNEITIYFPEAKTARAYFDITIKESTAKYSTGDVNMDTQINSSDALLILQSIVNLKTLSAEQKTLADMNSDHRVNSADALAILNIVVSK